MSLNIDVDVVVSVLLADKWHEVIDKSLELDAYEFSHQGRTIFGGGTEKETVSATGFLFRTNGGDWLAGPISAIQGVKMRHPVKKEEKLRPDPPGSTRPPS